MSRIFKAVLCLFVLLPSAVIGQDAQSDAFSSEAAQEDASPFDGIVFYCTKCMKEVPEHLGVGTECPHCAAFFESATNADGSESKSNVSNGISLSVWCGIALATIYACEYAVRRWRRRHPGTTDEPSRQQTN